jgi:hypothetical protein
VILFCDLGRRIRLVADHRNDHLFGWWVQSLSEPLSMQEQNIILRGKYKWEKPELHKSSHKITAQKRLLHPEVPVLPLTTA